MSASSKLIASSLLVPVVFALGCATTRSLEQQYQETDLALEVGSRLAVDQEIDRHRIDVDVLGAVVFLRGEVTDAEQWREAELIAAHTPGVARVVNQLEIDPTPRNLGETFADGWIAVQVDSKLARDPEVKSRNVDVDVHDGVVTLSGVVESPNSRTEAVQVAKTVDGVVKVRNELQVASSYAMR